MLTTNDSLKVLKKTRKEGWAFFLALVLAHLAYVVLGFGITSLMSGETPSLIYGGVPAFFLLSLSVMIVPVAVASIVYCFSKKSIFVFLCPFVMAVINFLFYVLGFPNDLEFLPFFVILPVAAVVDAMDLFVHEWLSMVILPSLVYALEIAVALFVSRKFEKYKMEDKESQKQVTLQK